ncbi:outer membrane lipoprotein-sorting protein [Alteromonas sp. a30]|uniref:outer membrane lipoprotein-sorting protein n=1 Tax=Alteromonas sp. a30 TaxID=2730917 RepID=UPI00227EA1C0|nr:outer membrane lipoprotein-sorting protein [Alteromonas sp. a30]MCY7296802.1 outer membrane lipoprotein-sorting protein [Alteromonas sp. a30]
MKKSFLALITFTGLALTSTWVSAKTEINVQNIIEKAEMASFYAGDDGRAEALMMIVDAQGRKQMRKFTILRKDIEDQGDQKFMVFFSRPTDVKNTVFRVEKHVALEQDDDRWLYLPALDLVKRISAGDKRTSFVGSHFFYEDVSGRSITEDDFSLVEENDAFYVLDAKPKKPESVEFSHYQIKIDKTTFLPMSINFYKGDKHYRQVETVKVESISGYPTVLRSKVSDLETGGYTLMEFRNVTYNTGVPDEVFTERSLRTPPQQWLQ